VREQVLDLGDAVPHDLEPDGEHDAQRWIARFTHRDLRDDLPGRGVHDLQLVGALPRH
jgi:hypothetical protein